MASREAVARGLAELRAWWASLPDTPQLLESTHEGCLDYDDVEFGQAIKRLTREHKAGWPPKLADIRTACAMQAQVRRAPAVQERRNARGDAYCPECGTETLEWSRPWPNGQSRMVPRHEVGCRRYDAENAIPGAVRMDTWPGRKPRQATPVVPISGPTSIAAIVTKGAA